MVFWFVVGVGSVYCDIVAMVVTRLGLYLPHLREVLLKIDKRKERRRQLPLNPNRIKWVMN